MSDARQPVASTEEAQVKFTTFAIVKRLWRDYVRHYKLHYSGAIFCLILLAATNAMIINQVPEIIDNVLSEGAIDKAINVGAIIFATLLIRGLCTFGQAVLLYSVGLNIIRRLQNQMFATLTSVDMLYLQKSGSAAQISRFTNDVHALQGATSRLVTGIGKEMILLLAMIATMFWYNAKMALVIWCIFPFILAIVLVITHKIRKVAMDIQLRLSDTTAMLDDSLKSAMQVRAYNLQEQEQMRAGHLFRKYQSLAMKSQVLQNSIYPILDGLGGILFSGVLVWGAYVVAGGVMSTGEFVTFFIAMFAAYTPLRSLSGLYAALQSGLAASERIFTLLDYRPQIALHAHAEPLRVRRGEIEFRDVDFAYNDDSPPALQHVNLTIEGGKRTAIVGYSGSGKSTLVQLIPRFFECDGGQILIDGQDIRRLDLRSLREQVAVVFQNAPLFNTSIGSNISLGKPVDKAKMQEVCKQALLEDFIASLPQSVDTSVGELGNLVSGGQRQRIAIARALLKDAPILLLDEATSGLDQENENLLHKALQKLMQGRTVVVIAHRLATVHDADYIYLLRDGRIVGGGTHQSLSDDNPYYRRLYRSGFAA